MKFLENKNKGNLLVKISDIAKLNINYINEILNNI